MTCGYRLKIIAIVQLGFPARSVDHPEVAAFAQVVAILTKQILREAEHGCHSRSRGDEDAVGKRFAQEEETMRTVEVHSLAHFKIAIVIGEEAAFDPVYAEVKLVAARCGGDGVGARLQLSIGVFSLGGYKLTGHKIERIQLIHSEDQMKTLRSFRDTLLADEPSGKDLTSQIRNLLSMDLREFSMTIPKDAWQGQIL